MWSYYVLGRKDSNMFSINFTRNGQEDCTQVSVRINTNLPITEHTIVAHSERSNQISAELLLRHLENEYHNLIENAHRVAYEQGFKDGRQHKKKKSWFHRKFVEDNTPAH